MLSNRFKFFITLLSTVFLLFVFQKQVFAQCSGNVSVRQETAECNEILPGDYECIEGVEFDSAACGCDIGLSGSVCGSSGGFTMYCGKWWMQSIFRTCTIDRADPYAPETCREEGIRETNWFSSCSGGGGPTATPAPTPSPGPTPTPGVGCTTTWNRGACGAGGCASSQRYWTRTVAPAGCGSTDPECRADSSCTPGVDGTVTGRVYCSVTGQGIDGVNLHVVGSADGGVANIATTTTVWPNNGVYSMTFPSNGSHFAVRGGASGGNNGWTPTGSETMCDDAGPLTQHESCPFSEAEDSVVPGFDFQTSTSASDLRVVCTATSATFTWDEHPNADRYILRINRDDTPDPWDGDWMTANDYWRWVPTNDLGIPTRGTCDGTTCTYTIDQTDPKPWMSGRYMNFNVTARDQGESHCSARTGVFTCEDNCVAPASISGALSGCGGGTGAITWTWSHISGATEYQLQVDAAPVDWASVARDLTLTSAGASCGGGTCSYTTTGLAVGNWGARVRVTQATGCTPYSPWTVTGSNVGISCNITGKVYLDVDNDTGFSGGRCDDPDFDESTTDGIVPNGSPVIAVNPGGYDTNDSGGSIATSGYVVPNVPVAAAGSYTASLSGFDTAQYACSCPSKSNPSNCAYGAGANIGSPDSDLHFMLTSLQDSWWQAEGGDIYSEGAIGSTIPQSCVDSGSCDGNLYLSSSEPGVLYACGGSWDTGSGNVYTDAVNPGDKIWRAESCYEEEPTGPLTKYGYDFWRAQFDDSEVNTTYDCTIPSETLTKPSSSGTYEISCNRDLTLDGDWNIAGNQINTIFVKFTDSANQKLNLAPVSIGVGEKIVLGSNSLVTFITNGSIEVNDTAERLDGIYITDGSFSTCVTAGCGYDSGIPTAYPLEVNGSVIAWGGVSLERDLFTSNFDTPGETFIYREDLINLLPSEILTVHREWKEVAP